MSRVQNTERGFNYVLWDHFTPCVITLGREVSWLEEDKCLYKLYLNLKPSKELDFDPYKRGICFSYISLRGALKCSTLQTFDDANPQHCKYWTVQPLNTGGLFVGRSQCLPFTAFCVCGCVCLSHDYILRRKTEHRYV